ncbi:hypothetical protein EDC01DRAFT_324743 [Geopyxis carbonaria]|nr:hypothetical protein EDC01DRAFT_324743 [Geopyxis carbonaria]
MVALRSLWLSVSVFATAVLSQTTAVPIASYCNSDKSVCAAVNIPNNGSSTFFQVTTSKSNGWTGVGIGSGMAGALIFLIYPNEKGTDVMVSPRIGTGHVEPQYESSIKYQVMQGTGISGNTLTASFICFNCRQWSGGDLTTTGSQDFIYAIGGSGVNIQSNDPEVRIQEHQQNGFFALDMARAKGGDGNSNPFSGNNGASNGNSGGTGTSAPTSKADRILIAHAVIMAFTWVILFPLGASVIRILSNRLPNALLIHRSLQSLNFILVIVGMALGIWTSGVNGTHFSSFHQYFGVILVALIPVQAALGQMHHMEFQKTGKRSPYSYAHIWFGRTVILFGIINGGIGLGPGLADASGGQIAAYAIIAIAVIAGYTFASYQATRNRSVTPMSVRIG